MAEAAEELGFDSVWVTEHIIVGPEAVTPFGRVYDPLVVLAWVAGFTQQIGLGTSIVLVPLHHPIRLAKEVATLQELSGGRVRLGVGVGWHKDEFRFMGYEFAGRGPRADEALRLMRALWGGERAFRGSTGRSRKQPSRRCPSRSPSSGSAGAPRGRFAGRASSETSGTRAEASGRTQ